MAQVSSDGQKNSGIFQMFLAIGAKLFKFLGAIGVVRKGGMVDTWDD
jgi:hypothetical protein